jgi:hypothetical protein
MLHWFSSSGHSILILDTSSEIGFKANICYKQNSHSHQDTCTRSKHNTHQQNTNNLKFYTEHLCFSIVKNELFYSIIGAYSLFSNQVGKKLYGIRVEFWAENELNLMSQIELFINFKRAEIELKKEFLTRAEFQAEPILMRSCSDGLDSTYFQPFLRTSSTWEGSDTTTLTLSLA